MTDLMLAVHAGHAALGPRPTTDQMRTWVAQFEAAANPLVLAADDRVVLPNPKTNTVARVKLPRPDFGPSHGYDVVAPGAVDFALIDWTLDPHPFRARIEVRKYYLEERRGTGEILVSHLHEKYLPWAGRQDPDMVLGRAQVLRAWAAMPDLLVELGRVLLAASLA